jgi:DNA repair exonuclease SbcCD nuclease subunit
MLTQHTTTMTITDLNTKTSKICCIADLHIGVHQNNSLWHDIALKWATWLKADLEEKNIHDIFILGDVYHYRDEVAVNTMHIVNQIFSLWKDFNITILVGNHDAYYKDNSTVNSLSLLNGKNKIRVIDTTQTFTLYGKTVTFLPWGASLSEIPKSDILFGHLEVESFKMNSYKLCEHGIKTQSLFDKARLIMTGHFHLREERQYDNGTIIYVGNPYEMDYGDYNSKKGYYILDVNDLSYNFYENTVSPKHSKVTVTELQQYKKDKKDIKDLFTNNIVRIIVDGNHAVDDIDKAIKYASDFDSINLSIDYSLHDNTIGINETISTSNSVDLEQTLREFIETLDIQNKKEIELYCIDILKKVK